jgi:hypothetical protein
MLMTFGEKVIAFNRQLEFTGRLPAGILKTTFINNCIFFAIVFYF